MFFLDNEEIKCETFKEVKQLTWWHQTILMNDYPVMMMIMIESK